MRFTTTAGWENVAAVASVSSIDDIENVDGSITFTCAEHDARAIILALSRFGRIMPGAPRGYTAPAPRDYPRTTALVRR